MEQTFEVPTCKVAMLTLIMFLHFLVLDNCTIVGYLCQLYYVSSTMYEFNSSVFLQGPSLSCYRPISDIGSKF
jgi:hypothetical protein